jgi:hypothetical protein
MMKVTIKLFAAVLFISLAQSAAAQFGPNPVAESAWMMDRRNKVFNFKYTFTVTMANGAVREVYSKILDDTAKHKKYLLYVDKSLAKSDSNRNQKIYPNQTISISRNLALVASGIRKADFPTPPRPFTGIAKDTCWMFKVISGPISVYSYLSEDDDQVYNPATFVGLQLNDGPIMNYNEANLKEMIGQNDINALEKVVRKNYVGAIKKYNRDKKSEKK